MKKDIAFIIPGYGMDTARREYQKIARYFEAKQIKPVFIKIKWHPKPPRDFNDYVKDFLKQAKKYQGHNIYALGFSFGAVIALLSHKKLKYKSLMLCSLSPYFEEDRMNLKPQWFKWWDKNYKNAFTFNKVIKGFKQKTVLLVGAKEHQSCLIRAKDAHRKIQRSKLKIVKGAEHKLQQAAYLDEVEKAINQLQILSKFDRDY